ncbi:hypothetical protein H5T87_00785 [bacterium]|nr:hypothetical protein [bacterium]
MKRIIMLILAILCFIASFAKDEKTANLVVNGGFENSKGGIPLDWSLPSDICTLDPDNPHSGKFSLRYTRTDDKDYRLVTQKLPCIPGKLYKVSVWVKGENIKGNPADQGAGFCIEWSDAEGKWLGGYYPSCISGTFNWTEISSLVRIPKEAKSVHITLYLRKGTTGTAWFDDVVVQRTAAPFSNIHLISPSYRGILQLPSKGKKALAKLTVNRDDYDLVGATIRIRNFLMDRSGKSLAKSEEELSAEKEEIILSLPLPELKEGNYYWIIQILTGDRELATENIPIKVVRKMNEKVYIDEKGRLIVDGKPFFPLGLYLGPTDEEHLKRISEAGFNTILCYGYGAGENPKAYMDRAEKYGLKVIYSIKDFYEGTPYFPQRGKSGLELAKEYVEELRNHPALLAWYINDELPVAYIPQLTAMFNLVKKLDPNHPQFQVLYEIPDLELYYNCTDIIGVDPYPIPSQPITMVSDWTRAAIKAMSNAKPVWVVPQIFDWSVYNPANTPREPTFEEKKNMFYQAIIQGAKGLIAYSYFDLLRTTGGKEADKELFERRWKEVSYIAGEIKKLIPILLEGEDIPQLQGSIADGKVLIRGLSHKGIIYILVANTVSEDSQISISIPGKGWRKAKRIDGSLLNLKGNKIVDSLKPYQATTYIISR